MLAFFRPFFRTVQFTPFRQFSEYFSNLDNAARYKHDDPYHEPKHYMRIQRKWKIPLARKQRKRERRLERLATIEKRPSEEEKLVVHSAEKGISLPAQQDQIFAVLQIGGTQYKVVKDDKVLCEKLPLEVGQKVELDKVLLVGTKDYTSIGRPYIPTAKVLASVEEQTKTKKIIVYKKKRRKSYQRNHGHRQDITVLHIEDIVHTPNENTLTQYSYLL